ncbi:prephenate dehydratase [Methanothermobacter sp.]|uniref:prephenate dehydratase n=1 Tax=Methanothermobacter sp. TaxID=1884223 RepID=UPI002622B39A|nr:prephenate dehydratase [Methanothermobacter sp.]MDI9618532.1 prephenate dehydratase [Methanothermobacter sp.]
MAGESIAYLGPEGTFTEEAALHIGEKLLAFDSILEVLGAVASGKASRGVVPIENSIEGPVGVTLDLLAWEYDLCIEREIILRVRHNLLVNRGVSLGEVREVYSHPQSLAQCRRFLEKLGVTTHSAPSTAAAARTIVGRRELAAIGTRRAADIYGLDVLAEDIQDFDPNFTRFIVLSEKDHEPTGRDKTSIVFSLAEDRPGGLYEVLGFFAEHGVNLTKIESRPSKRGLGKYIFFVDFEGHRKDAVIMDVLDCIADRTPFFKILGSYPEETVYE